MRESQLRSRVRNGNAMDHDYNQLLGVDPSADLDWIKTAYRHKASQCHPDRGGSHGMALPSIGTLIGGLTVAKLLSLDPTWFSVRPFSAMAFMGAGTLIGGELAVKLHQQLARRVFALAEPL